MQLLPIVRLAVAVLTLATTAAAGLSLPSAAQGQEACNQAMLPEAAGQLLRSEFPSWRPKQLSDLGADDRRLWLQAHPKECPGIVVGHFERMDQPAYAVLLVPAAKPTGGYKLVVLNESQSKNRYAVRVLDHADSETYSGLVMSSVAPGRFSDVESAESVQLKLDSIYLEWIEKGAQLFYWSDGRYRKIQVSN